MTDFGEQAFLLDFIKDFRNSTLMISPKVKAPVNRRQMGFAFPHMKTFEKPHTYEHVMRVDGDPTSCMNKLLYDSFKTSRIFDQFSPHQLTYLTPRIEIWKNHPTGKKDPKWIRLPYPINQTTTVDSILNSIEGRGTDVSLNSISWQDTGTDTAYAGVTMSGIISLSFQSFESLFMDRPTGEVDSDGKPIMISFAELTTNVPTKLKPEVAQDVPVSFYDTEVPPFELQLVVGWSVPDDKNNEIFDAAQLKAIGDAISILNILTNRVELKLHDGGKVDLNCQFHGRLETAMWTQRYNLFMIDPESLDTQERNAHVQLLQDTNQILQTKKAKHEKIEDTESKEYREIEKNLEITSQELYNIKSESLEAAWSKLLGKISSMTGASHGSEKGSRGRLFYVDINDETIEKYEELNNIRTVLRKAKKEKKLSDAGKSLSGVDQSMIDTYAKQRATLRQEIEYATTFALEEGGDGLAPQTANKLDSTKLSQEAWIEKTQKRQQGLRKANRSPDSKTAVRIHYFFLGDLFEAAMDIIINRPASNWDCANPVSGRNNIKKKELADEARLLLGSMLLTEPDTGKLLTVSIADLPISLNTFLLWWEKAVVEPRRTSLPLRSFLGEICGNLITAVLGVQGPVPDGSRRPTSRIQLASIDLPTGGIIDQIWKKYNKKINISQIAEMNEEHKKEKDGKKYETSQYLYLYPREFPKPPIDKMIGEVTEQSQWQDNLARGIPHLYVGNTKGMIQRVTFSRTKIDGHVESSILRSVREGRKFKSQLLSADKYDAQIDMFGNPFYKPGLQIYLDPRSLGLGYSVSRDWAKDLGLGGLYTVIGVSNAIAGGKYTTKLVTKSEVGLGLRKLVVPTKSTSSTPSISDKGKK